ncbi:hypothetical protein BH18THE1_BH18THE1_18570 [soil metagenome]
MTDENLIDIDTLLGICVLLIYYVVIKYKIKWTQIFSSEVT